MVVEGWLARAAARAARAHGARRRPRGRWSYAQLARRRARRRARAGGARRRARGSAWRSRCPAGLELRAGAARLPAARRGRRAGRPAPGGRRARARRRRRRGARRRAARRRRRSATALTSARRPGGVHDLDATAVVIHTSGTTAAPRPVELTYGNLLWSALGSAVALGLDPRGALAVRAAALARRRPLDPGALGDLRDDARSCTSASRPSACCARCASSEVTLVSLVATTLARLLDAGLRAPAGAALRAHRRRPGAGGARRSARTRPACPSASPTA